LRPKVKVLLSTFNGDKYLKEQLDSLLRQTYKEFEIVIRDDGSIDKTLDILTQYQKTDSRITLFNKPLGNLGPAQSFAALLTHNLDVPYIAFCDQDDVWNESKLEKSVERIRTEEMNSSSNLPILLHSDLLLMNPEGHELQPSMKRFIGVDATKSSLPRLLAQNIVTGCTVMINQSLAKAAVPIPKIALMHDAWLALIAAKIGKIIYLDEVLVSYRQHESQSSGGAGESKLLPKIAKKLTQQDGLKKLMLRRWQQSKALEHHLRVKGHTKAAEELFTLHQNISKNRFSSVLSASQFGIKSQGFLRTGLYYLLLFLEQPSLAKELSPQQIKALKDG